MQCGMQYIDEDDILIEDEVRLHTILDKPDQFSGKGCDFHVHKVVISDMGDLRTQYLTEEVFNNELFQAIIRCGSITKFCNEINASSVNGQLSYEDVYNALILARISRDPWFAFYVCFSIRYKKGGKGPFVLNYAQRLTLCVLEEMRMAGVPIRIIIEKARQWGGSTLVDLYIAWMQLFVCEQWNASVVAQTKDTARRIKDMYEFVLDNMPGVLFNVDKLKFVAKGRSAADFIISDKKNNVVRDNVMTVASYENFESVRGADFKMSHLSEVAFWRTTETKSAEKVMTNLASNVPTIPDTIIAVESTANGASGWFYNEYYAAKEGKSAFRSVFIPFFYIENDMLFFKNKKAKRDFVKWLTLNREETVAPDDRHESGKFLWELWLEGASLEHIYWYIETRKLFSSHDQMAQEAPYNDVECFIFSGGRIFSPKLVRDRKRVYVKDPVIVGDVMGSLERPFVRESNNGCFRVWKRPSKKRYDDRYVVVVDVGGRSVKADYSVITVLDRYGLLRKGGQLEVVARWRGHIRYDRLAWIAMLIGIMYGNAKLVFESNTFDKKKAEASEFIEQGDHIRGILKYVEDKYENLYMRPATDPEDIRNGVLAKVGFQTNSRTKQDMVDQFCVDFEDDNWIDPDERFYTEAGIYEQRPDGSYGNIVGKDNHDDILMTCMIASLVSMSMPKPSKHEEIVHSGSLNLGTRNESSF